MPQTDFELRTSDAAPTFGLTGGVASGKSTVARHFETLGARIIDADRIGHEVIEPGRPAYEEIISHFGKQLLDSNGMIDRKTLGALVFSNTQELGALNAIVHPRLIARQTELALEYLAQNPRAVVIVDAALIFESGIGGRLRKVIVAWCHPEQQLERLMAKAGLSRQEAERRIKAQMPVEEKRRRADYQIDCSGSLEETYREADAIYLELRRIVDGQ